jgi:hypothetical protein
MNETICLKVHPNLWSTGRIFLLGVGKNKGMGINAAQPIDRESSEDPNVCLSIYFM